MAPPPRLFAARAAGVAVCGCVLGLVALVFDAAPLFVPALALLALGVLAPAWVWLAARGAEVERRLPADRVVEQERVEAIISVRRGWLGLPGGEIDDPFTDARRSLRDSLALPRAGRRCELTAEGHFSRRGLHRLTVPQLTVRDPLDLARARTATAQPPQELLVLPATEPVRWLRPDQARRVQLPDGRDGSEALAAVDLAGLRPYRPGTPASRIHWPAVARGAGLLERRLEADGDTRPLVVLDSRAGSTPQARELLDAAVRAAASLVLELARQGGCGLLLPGERRPATIESDLIGWPPAYARLALVEDPGPGSGRAPAVTASAGRPGAMIYVAAAPVDRLGALLAGLAARSTILVVPEAGLVGGRPPGVRGSMLAALAVSGCQGFVLGVGRERDRPGKATAA